MTDLFTALVADWGIPALALITFLSCLALPVPASLAMLSAGAFVASGDLPVFPTVAAAFTGAVAGDHVGYGAGRWLGPRLSNGRKTGDLDAEVRRRGIPLVFYSRWLVSPLGPYVNVAAGAIRFNPGKFLIGVIGGEAVWVTLYVGLGAVFTSQIGALADLMGNLTGFLAALAVMAASAFWLRRTREH